MQSTYFPKKSNPSRTWFLLDASEHVLGRLATQAADLLRGKGKATFTPYLDEGDFVVIVNAAKVRLTGKKIEQKVIYRHSLYPGGLKLIPYKRLMTEKPEEAIRHAVSGMLSKSKLRDRMLRRLKIYRGTEHRHPAKPLQALKPTN